MPIFKKKDSKTGWYFPSGKHLEKTSASNAYVETFNDSKIESLAREICQNSLDAHDGSNKPVRVSFSLIEIDRELIPGYKDFINDIIPKAEKTWPNEAKTKRLLDNMKNILSKSKVAVLKISDENTTGLEPQNWISLIEQTGSSVKKNDDSGGSFGIGKAAPFAVSDLRMVFYNTLSSGKAEQSVGVSKFVSFDLNNGETTQGTGYYGENEKEPFNHGVSFEDTARTKRGTDVYIIGFNTEDFSNWKNDILYSLLDSFLVSINRKQLEVFMDDEFLTQKTISKHISEIKKDKRLAKRYIDLTSYYGVIEDKNHIAIDMPGYEGYGIKKGEAVLLLSNLSENNRKVLMTRKAGMKIFDKNRISGILKFSGVFYATGTNINKILKELENPNHDKWSVDRAIDKKQARLFLNHITNFIKDSVIQHYQEKITEEVDAFGVSDFLPSNLDAIKEAKKEMNEMSLVQKNANVQLKTLVTDILSTSPIRSNESGELSEEQVRKVDLDDDGELEGGFIGEKDATMTSEPNDFKNADGFGNKITESEKGELKALSEITRKKIGDLKYRVIEMDAKNGEYRILLNPSHALKNAMIKVAIIGDSGNKTEVNIKKAINLKTNLITNRNSIFLNELDASSWAGVDICLNQMRRLKLEVEIYANTE